MDDNKKIQNNSLRIPPRDFQDKKDNSRAIAADYRLRKVEQIYQSEGYQKKQHALSDRFRQKQTKPVSVKPENYQKTNNVSNFISRENIISQSISEVSAPAKPKPQANFKSGVGVATERINSSVQRIVNPLQNKQEISKVGAVEYKPNNENANLRNEIIQKDNSGEQWKRYHAAWQNYYQKYYESYYSAALEQHKQKIPNIQPEVIEGLTDEQKKDRALAKLRKDIARKAKEQGDKIRKSRHFMPIFSAMVVVLLFLFLQYNRLIFASVEAYVSPGNANANQTVYSPNASTSVSNDPKLIIPKINVDVPVIYGAASDKQSQLNAMSKGVSHFSIPGASAVPGQNGNTVFSGHSSNDVFDQGEYKFIFAQLDKLQKGDLIYANYNGTRYTYSVTRTEVVWPNEVDHVQIGTDKPYLTLITCVPLGTARQRLLVFAEQISPDPSKAAQAKTEDNTEKKSAELPRNSRTFFEKLFSWNWTN